MIKILQIILLLLPFMILSGCSEEENEVYDHPFVHINYQEVSSVVVPSRGTLLREYNVYLSSKPLSQLLEVDYEIIVGDGLSEGEDFEILTKGRSLKFLPGIYDMPIRIKWLANEIDASNDNRIIIRLLSNSMGFSIGFPGPDKLESELIITKMP